MLLTYITFAVALCLSAIGAFYSIMGLAAIFAAAVVPIMIMGGILEVSKIVVTLWLHEYWSRSKLIMRCYLVPAVAILMLITSMGIFGFLSKAHLDQSVPASDVSAQVGIFDEKIKTERDNVDTARRALQQMDAQVDQMLGRTTDDRGAERAVQIRRQQARERARLQNEIAVAQKNISSLQAQRAPLAAEARKVEAEVGPVKYIAALIYGDNPDANLLERAVRWVIILLVAVFDPLAIFMLLAATESLAWERARRSSEVNSTETSDTAEESTEISLSGDQLAPTEMPSEVNALADKEPESLSIPVEPTPPPSLVINPDPDDSEDIEDSQVVKQAKFYWKQDHPDLTLKEQRRRLAAGEIDELPWMSYVSDPRVLADASFGTEFPDHAQRGEVFVHTGYLPTRLYKFTGDKWIEIDKHQTDSYVYNNSYIYHLIAKISAGEYDPELLTDSERAQIEAKLKQEV